MRKWYKNASEASEKADVPGKLIEVLADDLNTHEALTEMHRLASKGQAAELAAALDLMGLWRGGMPGWAREAGPSEDVANLINSLLEERKLARIAKDFARADALRDGFADAGVIVKDTPDGAEWELSPAFDPERLEALK